MTSAFSGALAHRDLGSSDLPALRTCRWDHWRRHRPWTGWLITANVNGIHGLLAQPPGWLAWSLAALTAVTLLWTILRLCTGRILPIMLGLMIAGILGLFTTLVFILDAQGGVVIWDPAVYYFSEVPNSIDLPAAIITMIGAVIFSLIGAAIPAARAADVDPVEALRYE